jgi:hypothetical protein
LSDFERGQIVAACLTEVSVTKTTTLGVLRATVSKVVSSIHESWEDGIREEKQWVKSTLTERDIERDCFEKTQN